MSRPRAHQVADALERLPLPVYTLDADGVVTWANAAAKELVGDAIGKRHLAVLAPESRPGAKEAFARKVVGEEPSTEYEAVLLRSDGSRVRVEISSVPIELEGRIVGVFGVLLPGGELPRVDFRALTPRQAQVLRLLSSGAATPQIAAQLGVSLETARNHIRRLLKQLGVHSRLEAVIEGQKRGLL